MITKSMLIAHHVLVNVNLAKLPPITVLNVVELESLHLPVTVLKELMIKTEFVQHVTHIARLVKLKILVQFVPQTESINLSVIVQVAHMNLAQLLAHRAQNNVKLVLIPQLNV